MTSQHNNYIAVDLGAESGRVMLASLSAEKITIHEIHRFANTPLDADGSIRWNFPEILKEIKAGLAKAINQADGSIAGIAVDSWGSDFGLLDENDQLLENPYHYRDPKTNGIMDKAFALMPKRSIFEHTGSQFMQGNSLYQLLAMRLSSSPSLAKAKKLIFIADLVSYFLCSRPYAEYTLASTSQFMNMHTGQWSNALLKALDLPAHILPEIVKPGTVVGQLQPHICEELACEPIKVIAVGSHDTASAVVAVPAQQEPWAYISSGTWSLMGVEIPTAIINDTTFKYALTNEGGVNGTIRLLKIIMGLWPLQQCRREWQRQGTDLSYDQLTDLAARAKPFAAFIDPDCPDFLAPGDMPRRINNYLARTSQQTIDDKGQMARVILEGLALRYAQAMRALEEVTDKNIKVLHIVGGGSKNELLAQFASNATGKKVLTGPTEATACGNVLTQALACGQLDSLKQGRRLIANSFELKEFQPADIKTWAQHCRSFPEMT